jgi:hypothetical protein
MTDDLTAQLADKLPVFIGAILLTGFLLMVLVFRSIVVPLKAALLNLLSIGAAYGVVVAIFQWGWLRRVRPRADLQRHLADADHLLRGAVRPLGRLRGLPHQPHPRGVRRQRLTRSSPSPAASRRPAASSPPQR